MKLERKVYTTRNQKVGDFMIGVGLCIGLNFLMLVLYTVLATLLSTSSQSATSSVNQTIAAALAIGSSFLPFLINIALIIYFGMTRYWIALGMLGGFAIALLIVLILGAVCFALIYGFSAMSQ